MANETIRIGHGLREFEGEIANLPRSSIEVKPDCGAWNIVVADDASQESASKSAAALTRPKLASQVARIELIFIVAVISEPYAVAQLGARVVASGLLCSVTDVVSD